MYGNLQNYLNYDVFSYLNRVKIILFNAHSHTKTKCQTELSWYTNL